MRNDIPRLGHILSGALRNRRAIAQAIVLVVIAGFLLWWYRPDPHLVRTIAMDDRVSAVAFSPDGATLAVGLYHGMIELRTVATGAVLRQLPGHADYVYSLAFSPDGQQLVSGANDGTVRLWSLTEPFAGRVVIQKPPVGNLMYTDDDGQQKRAQVPFYRVAFSPDGRTIAAGSDGGLAYLVDTTGAHERQLQVGLEEPSINRITTLTFDARGSRIAFVAMERFLIVQLDRDGTVMEQIQIAKRDGDAYYTLQFHDQDATLRSFDSVGYFSAWSLHTPGTITEVRIDYPQIVGPRILSMAQSWKAKCGTFSADGRLIAFGAGITSRTMDGIPILGSHDTRVFVVRAGETAPWLTLSGHGDYVNAVAFSPHGDLLASGSDDHTLRLWRVE
jgi:WD40 repeat protein